MTPNEIARELDISPKTFRAWLRDRWRKGDPLLADHALNEHWIRALDEKTSRYLIAEYTLERV